MGTEAVDQARKTLIRRLLDDRAERVTGRAQADADHGKTAEVGAQSEDSPTFFQGFLQMLFTLELDGGDDLLRGKNA